MINNDKHKTWIFAHRGANREAAENTRAAFDKALQYAIDGMETDVQLTQDEVTVLWHDEYTEKLAYPGKRIDDFNFTELEQINFSAPYSPTSPAEGVLSLKEFISKYRGRCRLQIEIKNRDWEAITRHQSKIRQTLKILGSAQQMDVFISSFNLQSMIYADQFQSNIPLFYALDENSHFIDVTRALTDHVFLAGLCLPIQVLDKNMMQFIRSRNKKILTYTCNSDEHIQKALALEVDVLISDDPVKALTMRETCNESFPD